MVRLLLSASLFTFAGFSNASAFDPIALEKLISNKACVNCDLSGANLSEKVLSGATFFKSN